MSTMILFNTLAYAKLLTKGGVEHADVHADALAEALAENLYSQTEVDKMIEAALKRFDERTFQLREEMQKDRENIQREFHLVHMEIRSTQDKILKHVYTALGIILAVVALSSNLIHVAH